MSHVSDMPDVDSQDAIDNNSAEHQKKRPAPLRELPLRHKPTSLATVPEDRAQDFETSPVSSEDGSWHKIPYPQSHKSNRTNDDRRQPPNHSNAEYNEKSALYDAVLAGDVDAVRANLGGRNLEQATRDGYTYLVVAILEGHLEVVKLLLERGADVHHRVAGLPPFIHAIKNDQHTLQIMQLLLDHGANPKVELGRSLMNALHFAAMDGVVDAVDFLLGKELVDVDITCTHGRTALILAAEKGHLTIVKVLIAKGADLKKRSSNGGTALHWAAMYNDNTETVGYLLQQGIEIDDCDSEGRNPLSLATALGQISTIKFLLSQGADINKMGVSPKDCTPTMCAILDAPPNLVEVLETLVEHGADIGLQTPSKRTALDMAMKLHQKKSVQFLLQKLGGPSYPLESVALQISMAPDLGVCRDIMNASLITFAKFNPPTQETTESDDPSTQATTTLSSPVSHMPTKLAWLDWVLKDGGELVKPRTLITMMHVAFGLKEDEVIEALLEHGADPNLYFDAGHTPLSYAISRERLNLVRILIKAGADLNKPANYDEFFHPTPLHQALVMTQEMVHEMDTSIIDLLLETGQCKLLAGKEAFSTAFHWVLESFDTKESGLAEVVALKMLKSIPDVNVERTKEGHSLLHIASSYGRKDLVDILLEHGADINITDNYGRTPLLYVCQTLQPTDTLEHLVEKGADVHVKDNEGQTALHLAATLGRVATIDVLVSKGLDVNAENNDGYTPLYNALDLRHEDAAMFLLDHGANKRATCLTKEDRILHFALYHAMDKLVMRELEDPDVSEEIRRRTKGGASPLGIACQRCPAAIIKALLEKGADTEVVGDNGNRPIHVALQNNEPAALVLIEHGADITATGTRGRMPIHFAAEFNHAAAAKLLLEKGASITAVDEDGWTPLGLAGDDLDITRLLLDRGADIEAKDKYGWTPLHQAVGFRNLKVFAELVAHGGDIGSRSTDDCLSVFERIHTIEPDIGQSMRGIALARRWQLDHEKQDTTNKESIPEVQDDDVEEEVIVEVNEGEGKPEEPEDMIAI